MTTRQELYNKFIERKKVLADYHKEESDVLTDEKGEYIVVEYEGGDEQVEITIKKTYLN